MKLELECNWSICNCATVVKITKLKLMIYHIFKCVQVNRTFSLFFLESCLRMLNVFHHAVSFSLRSLVGATACLVMHICMCTWKLTFLYIVLYESDFQPEICFMFMT